MIGLEDTLKGGGVHGPGLRHPVRTDAGSGRFRCQSRRPPSTKVTLAEVDPHVGSSGALEPEAHPSDPFDLAKDDEGVGMPMTRRAKPTSKPKRGLRRGTAVIVLLGAFLVGATAYLWSVRNGPGVTPWARLGTQDVHSLAFAPGSRDQLYFGHHGGVLASSDGGRQWRSLGAAADAMGMRAAADGSIVIAGHEVLQESTDGGATWQSIRNDLPNTDIHAFARDPVEPTRMWAYLATGGVYESADGGRSWAQSYAGHRPFLLAIRSGESSRLLGIDPGSGLVASSDGGRTWTSVSTPPAAPVQSLAATADGRSVFLGGPRGLLRSVDGGRSWAKTGLESSTLALAVSDDGRTVIAVSRTTDFYRSDDGGASWLGPPA